MTRPIYDPTSNRLLPADSYQALDESGLSVVRSPHSGRWFVLDPWTWTSRLLESVPAEARVTLDETVRTEQVGERIDEAAFDDASGLPAWATPREPARAAGGVMIDQQSRVLLRAPRGAFGGYVWTFPKGQLDSGENWPVAALREVEEESGWSARIVGRVGTYRGTTSLTRFYLMKPVSKTGEPDEETEAIVWVRPERAVQLLNKTRTPRGRERDLTVLRDALALHDEKLDTQLLARVSWSLSKLIGWPDVPDATEAVKRPRVRVVLPSSLVPV